jgi:putative spermidine/putrescine transport system permease protein
MAAPAHTTPLGRAGRFAFLALCGLLFAFLLAPILVIVPLSFSAGEFFIYPLPGLSLRWYRDLFTNPIWLNAARNSLIVGGSTTVLATVLGTLAALGLAGARFRGRTTVMALLISPMVVPLVITAVAAFFFYARLNLVGTYLGLILAHTTLALPFVVITVTATLQGFNANLVRAGASLGGSPPYVFFTIVLPLILPGVVSGALFAFATSFDEVVVALFLAAPEQRTLPRQIFDGVRQSITPTVTAVAAVLILISVLLMAALEWLRRRNERLRGLSGAR